MVLKCQKNTGEEEAVSIMDLQDLKKKGKSFTTIFHRITFDEKQGVPNIEPEIMIS